MSTANGSIACWCPRGCAGKLIPRRTFFGHGRYYNPPDDSDSPADSPADSCQVTIDHHVPI
jgi:hypothetical protein